MKTIFIDGVTWFLEEEGLANALEGLALEKEPGRAHEVRNYGKGKVFIKYFREEGLDGFLRHRFSPRGKKEYLFGKKLLSLRIPTAVPLGYGIAKKGSYVIQGWIEGETLAAALQRPGERKNLLYLLAALLRDLMAKGVRHNDLHLENILVCEKGLYVVDLHKAQARARFSHRDELSNLCHALLMAYGGMTEEERQTFYRAYGSGDVRPEVEAGLQRFRRRWIERKGRRAFRNTSKISAVSGRVAIRGREDAGRGSFVEAIKTDRKVIVERYTDHVRKIYRDKGRLERAWRNHVTLEYLGLRITPEPFRMEVPSKGKRGFIAMEDLKGQGIELDRHLDRVYDSLNGLERREMVMRFAFFLRTLLDRGILHRDLKACNLFVVNGHDLLLLDVEDITFAVPDRNFVARMLVQLATTVPVRIRMRDRLRFFANVTRNLTTDRKQLLREVKEESLRREIVYEGVSGLKKESWPGHH